MLRRTLRGIPRGQPGCGFRLDLDTQAFFSTGAHPRHKLGLGSSAALTVACASAVSAHVQHEDSSAGSQELQGLLQIHRDFQHGHGSGVDIATSLLGGTLVYRRDPSPAQAQAVSTPWPSELSYRFVWTGHATSTTDMLQRLSAWADRHRGTYETCMQHLRDVAEAGASALIAGDGAALLEHLRQYALALQELDAQAGLGIVSAEHRRLTQIADRHGVLYKSCGAGGGDLGVALSLDNHRLNRFQAAVTEQGFVPVPIQVDEPGLRCDFNAPEEP